MPVERQRHQHRGLRAEPFVALSVDLVRHLVTGGEAHGVAGEDLVHGPGKTFGTCDYDVDGTHIFGSPAEGIDQGSARTDSHQRGPVEGEQLTNAPQAVADRIVYLIRGQIDELAREVGDQQFDGERLRDASVVCRRGVRLGVNVDD